MKINWLVDKREDVLEIVNAILLQIAQLKLNSSCINSQWNVKSYWTTYAQFRTTTLKSIDKIDLIGVLLAKKVDFDWVY